MDISQSQRLKKEDMYRILFLDSLSRSLFEECTHTTVNEIR